MRIKVKSKISIGETNPVAWACFAAYIVLSLIVTQIFSIQASRLAGIIILIPIALMLLSVLVTSNGKITVEFSSYHLYILTFGVFCLASSLWAESPRLAISKGVDIIEILIIMMIVSFCFQKGDIIDPLLKSIMWAYYFVIIFELVFYGWNYFVQIMRDASRLTSDTINSNTIGMCASFAMIINLHMIATKKVPIWTLVLVIVGVVVVSASGSRKALSSLIIGIFLYFFFRSLRKNQRTLPFIRFLITLPILILVTYKVLQLPMFNGIMERFRGMISIVTGGAVEKSAFIRMSLTKLGFSLFIEHPVLGIGIDNPRLYTYDIVQQTYYLHNNYVELLSAGGVVGTAIYYSVYIKLLISYIRHSNFDNPQYCICFVLLLLMLIMDYGNVSYYSKTTYVFLLLLMRFDKKLMLSSAKAN